MKKSILLILSLINILIVSAGTGEERISLNGNWKFKTDPYRNGVEGELVSTIYTSRKLG